MPPNDLLPLIFLVEDDNHLSRDIRDLFEEQGQTVEAYDTGESFLAAYRPDRDACLVCDVNLAGGMSGLVLLQRLKAAGIQLPTVMITGMGDVRMAVQAMKAGAVDFIQKPVTGGELLATVAQAMALSRQRRGGMVGSEEAKDRLSGLTARQRQVLDLVLAGYPSKNIAADLQISQRTVENHRASIMRKSGSKSLPALTRLALAATEGGPSP
jgi:two-component system CheB/CheR fusion protein